jgi:hypothetical protein
MMDITQRNLVRKHWKARSMIYLTTFGGGLFHGPADGDPQARSGIVNFSQNWRWGR